MSRSVRYIFVHTAAFDGPADVETIDRWHRARGWDGIGYHYVVRRSGEVQQGRPLEQIGAHVLGVNRKSVGICCEGHGDHADFTREQKESLVLLCSELMDRFEVPVDHVLGHREVNTLVNAGVVAAPFRTSKTCPGTKVSMDNLRARIRLHRTEPDTEIVEDFPTQDIEPEKVEQWDDRSRETL